VTRGYLVKIACGAVVSALSLGGGGGCGGKSSTTGEDEGAAASGGAANGGGGLQIVSAPRPEKVDLLFMIDSSADMAEKQRLLSQAVGGLVESVAEVVGDIHIGVITSSLGDHGSGDICSTNLGSTTIIDHTFDDHAHLLPTVRQGLASSDDAGFLAWDPGASDAAHDGVIRNVADHVTAAGEAGCAFEASLEAWYRFLVDPDPVGSMSNNGMVSVRGLTSALILDQRAAFLRPDSLLVIVMLTDENDCSIVDEPGTQGWLIPYKGGPNMNHWRMPRAHSVCATNPNASNCAPCGQGDPDPGCTSGVNHTDLDDPPNLRCYRQKQRFGIDLLYPTQRYVDALTEPSIDPRYNGTPVDNPIFRPYQLFPGPTLGPIPEGQRPASWVILAGIVGVPWQDLATTDSLEGEGLTYLSASELESADRWDLILGGGTYGAWEPLDPFMLESIDPRPAGEHPLLPYVRPEPPNLDRAAWNPINGHEQYPGSLRDDLQFACTFSLQTAVACTPENGDSCRCNANELEYESPLCDYSDGPDAGVQVMTGAYPSLRNLQVLKDLGDQAVTTSICPKSVVSNDPEMDPTYGYNPAMAAIASRMREAMLAQCLEQQLTPDESGRVACHVYEVRMPANEPCSCDENIGRAPVSSGVASKVASKLVHEGRCGGRDQRPCSEACTCEIQQFEGPELETCQTTLNDPGNLFGYCYIDQEAGVGDESIVESCPADRKRILRFIGANVPAKDGMTLMSCSGG